MVFFGVVELDWEIIAAQEILIQAKTDVVAFCRAFRQDLPNLQQNEPEMGI